MWFSTEQEKSVMCCEIERGNNERWTGLVTGGRPNRSSEEVAVMDMERRVCHVQFIKQLTTARDD